MFFSISARLRGAERLPGVAPGRQRRSGARQSARVSSPEREILDLGFDAFNRGDFHTAVRYFHPEIVWRDPQEVPDASEHHGPDQVQALWHSFGEQWTGMRMDPV